MRGAPAFFRAPPVRRFTRVLAPAFAAAVLGGTARPARADVTSWLSLEGGAAIEHNRQTRTRDGAAAMSYAVGVGSSPLAPIVVGGLFRGTTMFNLGTDIGVALRVASGGFARGGWGMAVDAGALWRSWGNGAYGEWPLQAALVGGSPWGLEVTVGSSFWDLGSGRSTDGFFATVGIDLLRLTLMRQGPSEQWWPNPNPAGGHRSASASP